MLTLEKTHPVAIQAAIARRAADDALKMAKQFQSLVEQQQSSSETKTNSPVAHSKNDLMVKIQQQTRKKSTIKSTRKKSNRVTQPKDYLAPRLYPSSKINEAAKKSIHKYKSKNQNKPNVRWRAITDAVLELHPNFNALPDPTEIVFRNLADLTKFRQSSWQSEELHKCRVTTRHLLHALGLSSSKKLANGMSIANRSIGPKSMEYVRKELSGQRPTSYGYLCQTTMITRDVVLRDISSHIKRKNEIPKIAKWTFDQNQKRSSGMSQCVLSNHAEPLLGIQICFGQPKVGERLIVYANSVETDVKYWKLNKHPCHANDNNEYCLIGCGRAENFVAGIKNLKKIGNDGERIVMMEADWESESDLDQITWIYDDQENTFKHKYSNLYLCVDTIVNGKKTEIPVWTPTTKSESKTENNNQNHNQNQNQNQNQWTHALRSNLSEKITKSKDRSVPSSFRHAKDVAMAWGGVQEPTVVLAIINEFPNDTLEEVGCALLESSPERIPKSWKIDIGDLPLIGASPDAMIIRANGTREVVEIKNVCPIIDVKGQQKVTKGQQKGKQKNGSNFSYKGFDIGTNKTPPIQIPASHMPQIQMEMFCTDTRINNYVVASGFHGINMFRVERNDQYIKIMLELLRNLELEVVRKLPSTQILESSFFDNEPRYERLRLLSIQLCQKTALWRQIFPTNVQRGGDDNLWL